MSDSKSIVYGAISDATPARSRLDSLQALRALAAIAVVMHHAIGFFTENIPPSCAFAEPVLFGWYLSLAKDVATAGVDVFFVLSGFIIVYISEPYANGGKSTFDFVARRFIRIYPLYVLTTLYYAGFQTSVAYYPLSLVRSLLFVPYTFAPGIPEPVLGVAWTLYFEVLFYAYFTVALLFGHRHVVKYLIGITLSVMILGKLIKAHIGSGALVEMLASSVILEFVCGCILASLWRSQQRAFRVNGLISIFFGVLLMLASEHGFWFDALGRGIPATLIVFGFLCLDYRSFRFPKWSMAVGDASYAIYLSHCPLIAIWILQPLALRGVRSGNGYTTDFLICFSVIASILAGCLVHFLIERPIQHDLTNAYKRRLPRQVMIR